MKRKLFLSMATLWVCLTASAVDIYVNPTTGNDTSNGSKATPLKTIETAVFKVVDNTQTTIYIEKNSVIKITGILNFGENKKVKIIGQNVTIKADELPAQKDPTGDLNAGGLGTRILRAATNCDLKIKGITFRNARQVGYLLGGAIYFAGNTLEIDSCKFYDNQAGSCGGAIAARALSVVVKNSYFEGNNILGGGAVGAAIMQCGKTAAQGTLSVQNCTFYKNTTQNGGAGVAIGIYDTTDSSVGGKVCNVKSVEVTNCVFMENTSTTPYQASVDVSNGDPVTYLVNNTFYKNSDCAFRLSLSQAYLANNVIVGGKQGLMTETGTGDGRPELIAVNNIIVGSEGGINGGFAGDECLNGLAGANSNIVKTTTAYPLSNVNLATSLSTDKFVPYLAINSATSTLVDAGIDNTTAKFGANYVLPVDIRSYGTKNIKDIGAYEYNGIPLGISAPEFLSENYLISQSGNAIRVVSGSDKSFSMSVINVTGKVVYSTQATGSVEVSKSKFGHGVFILILNDGTTQSSKKVLF